MIAERRKDEGYGFWWDLVHIGQGLFGLSLLWDLFAGTINQVSTLALGTQYLPMVWNFIVWEEGLCEIIIGPEICGVLKGCFYIAGLAYLTTKLLCWTEWVKEEIKWEDCWDEISWKNPWSWIKTVVCVTKTIIRWVLKQLCDYIDIFVVVFVVVCIIAGLVVLSN